jgi:hypothetical protein
MPSSTSTLRQAIACLFAYSACNAAHAAEWSAQPSAWWYLDYDTNRTLAAADQGSFPPDSAGYMTLDMLLRRLTDTGELDLHPQLQFQRFTKNSSLNANNGSVQLLGSHRSQLWALASSVGYSQNSTLVTELASTGIIDANARQDALTADANATRKLTALASLKADISYSDISYPGGMPAGLVGYKYYSGSLAYAYTYSLRSTFSLIAFGGELHNELGIKSSNEGARLQWVYTISELLTTTVSAGLSQADLQGGTNSGSVWNFSLVRRTDQEGKWSFSIGRDVEPDGRGILINHEEADLSFTHAVAPHLSFTVTGVAVRNNNDFSGVTQNDRHYFAGDLGVEWRAAREWQLSFTGGYSQATQPEPYEYAHGWRAAATLRWTPLPWSLSR